jgi:hypothetical protein
MKRKFDFLHMLHDEGDGHPPEPEMGELNRVMHPFNEPIVIRNQDELFAAFENPNNGRESLSRAFRAYQERVVRIENQSDNALFVNGLGESTRLGRGESYGLAIVDEAVNPINPVSLQFSDVFTVDLSQYPRPAPIHGATFFNIPNGLRIVRHFDGKAVFMNSGNVALNISVVNRVGADPILNMFLSPGESIEANI